VNQTDIFLSSRGVENVQHANAGSIFPPQSDPIRRTLAQLIDAIRNQEAQQYAQANGVAPSLGSDDGQRALGMGATAPAVRPVVEIYGQGAGPTGRYEIQVVMAVSLDYTAMLLPKTMISICNFAYITFICQCEFL
jgi:hypothetical protein